MKKIMTIIGARPQIIKAAALSRVIQEKYKGELSELIVHTGQHYDENMSAVFFEELGIPKPFAQLSAGGGSHGGQTGQMLIELEQLMQTHQPDAVLVYGDTNSTLAGALAASKIGIPVVHVEAGLRSFNKSMPEEINRIATDHVSSLLFSPTAQGVRNLEKEGFDTNFRGATHIDRPVVYHCGDVMYDNSLFFSKLASEKSDITHRLGCEGKPFILATVHRNTNTDDPDRLKAIFTGFTNIAQKHQIDIVVPLHPRTRKYLSQLAETGEHDYLHSEFIRIIDPVGFLDMIRLEQEASLVVTDSGGVQKEAFFFQKPCVVLRDETEWVELIHTGAARLVGANRVKLEEEVDHYLAHGHTDFPPVFGDGNAGAFICERILNDLFKDAGIR